MLILEIEHKADQYKKYQQNKPKLDIKKHRILYEEKVGEELKKIKWEDQDNDQINRKISKVLMSSARQLD